MGRQKRIDVQKQIGRGIYWVKERNIESDTQWERKCLRVEHKIKQQANKSIATCTE